MLASEVKLESRHCVKYCYPLGESFNDSCVGFLAYFVSVLTDVSMTDLTRAPRYSLLFTGAHHRDESQVEFSKSDFLCKYRKMTKTLS